MTCKHEHIQTWRFEDGEVAMWSCVECALKFEPITARAAPVAQQPQAEAVPQPEGRCRWCLTYNGHQDGCPEAPQQAEAVPMKTRRVTYTCPACAFSLERDE